MNINHIIIHAADTYPSMDIGLAEITQWHTDPPPKGNGWSAVGYHYIIRRNGDVEEGRRNDAGDYVTGAHVRGRNSDSLAICLVGGKAHKGELACNYTREQWASLERLVRILTIEHPTAAISGHNDWDKSKQCPCFDVKAWASTLN